LFLYRIAPFFSTFTEVLETSSYVLPGPPESYSCPLSYHGVHLRFFFHVYDRSFFFSPFFFFAMLLFFLSLSIENTSTEIWHGPLFSISPVVLIRALWGQFPSLVSVPATSTGPQDLSFWPAWDVFVAPSHVFFLLSVCFLFMRGKPRLFLFFPKPLLNHIGLYFFFRCTTPPSPPPKFKPLPFFFHQDLFRQAFGTPGLPHFFHLNFSCFDVTQLSPPNLRSVDPFSLYVFLPGSRNVPLRMPPFAVVFFLFCRFSLLAPSRQPGCLNFPPPVTLVPLVCD